MTSAEIVKALQHCATVDGSGCYECPAKSEFDCEVLMKAEAADLLERLEKEKAALISTISGFCQWCKNSDADKNSCRVWTGCSICDRKCPCAVCRDGSKWEWKGLEDAL